MRAMLLERQADIGASPLREAEVPDPQPGAGEIRVRVQVCAICRTDLHIIEGDLPLLKTPIIPGHQVVGTVDQLGEGSTRFSPGQRVGIAWLHHTDGTCRFCLRGKENLCDHARYTGWTNDGGYAQYTVAPEDFVYELPEGDDVLLSPLLCAGLIGYRALQRARTPPEGKLLLVGFGSSAHIVLQIARHRGHPVYVVTRDEQHRQLARGLGAVWAGEHCEDLPEKMDGAILFAPAGGLVPPIMEALDKGAACSMAGIHVSDIPPLNYDRHLFWEKELVSVTANTRADGRALLKEAADAGVMPHVQTYTLNEANRALQDMKHDRIDGTGVLLT
jgi:propanol-preferring alcohol dehydrogenase